MKGCCITDISALLWLIGKTATNCCFLLTVCKSTYQHDILGVTLGVRNSKTDTPDIAEDQSYFFYSVGLGSVSILLLLYWGQWQRQWWPKGQRRSGINLCGESERQCCPSLTTITELLMSRALKPNCSSGAVQWPADPLVVVLSSFQV